MYNVLRLKRNEDFRNVYQRGKSFANRQLVLYYFRNDSFFDQEENIPFRLGISVSRKLGHAVERNRIKRSLKAIVLKQHKHIRPGFDYVCIVRQQALDMNYDQLTKSFSHVIRKSGHYI